MHGVCRFHKIIGNCFRVIYSVFLALTKKQVLFMHKRPPCGLPRILSHISQSRGRDDTCLARILACMPDMVRGALDRNMLAEQRVQRVQD